MARHELIDRYIADLSGRLRWRPDVDAVTDELHDHLYSAVEQRTSGGMSSTVAQQETISSFGSPTDVAMDFATTGTKGLAVPTTFTASVGRLGPLVALGWLLVAGWFYAGWVSLIGFGALIVAVAAWRRSLAPRRAIVAFGASWLVAGTVGATLRLLEVGTSDRWGDYELANIAALVIGCLGYAVALAGLGRWMAREEPVTDEVIRAMALADPADHTV